MVPSIIFKAIRESGLMRGSFYQNKFRTTLPKNQVNPKKRDPNL